MSLTLRKILTNYFRGLQTTEFIPKDLIIKELQRRGCKAQAESIGRELRDMAQDGLLEVTKRVQANKVTKHAWYRSILKPKMVQRILYTEAGTVHIVYEPAT